MQYDALVIVDMQVALVGHHPCNEKSVLQGMVELIEACRKSKVPIVYVRHDGGIGDELERGSKGWEICAEIAPALGEKVFDKQRNSAFRQTGLHEYLQQQGISRLLMCGMQTEYCFDVSVKVAFEYGYDVTIPQGLVTTFDNDFASGEALTKYFENEIWNGRYAHVIPLIDVLTNCQHL